MMHQAGGRVGRVAELERRIERLERELEPLRRGLDRFGSDLTRVALGSAFAADPER